MFHLLDTDVRAEVKGCSTECLIMEVWWDQCRKMMNGYEINNEIILISFFGEQSRDEVIHVALDDTVMGKISFNVLRFFLFNVFNVYLLSSTTVKLKVKMLMMKVKVTMNR